MWSGLFQFLSISMDLFLSRISHRSVSKTCYFLSAASHSSISDMERIREMRDRWWGFYCRCTHVSKLYRRIPSASGRERMPSDNVPSADFRVRAVSSLCTPSVRMFDPKAGIKRAPWQFFNDFTGSTSGFTIRKTHEKIRSPRKNSAGISECQNLSFERPSILTNIKFSLGS